VIWFGILLAVVAVLLLAGTLYQAVGRSNDRRRYPAPGRMLGSPPTHIEVAGQPGPAVVFESGISASCLNWTHLFRTLSAETTVVRYDRDGLGWSTPDTEPITGRGLIARLRRVLDEAGIPKPWILVGHSYGGLLCRLHASLYPNDIAGLVLVDPLLAEEWRAPNRVQELMRTRALQLSRRGSTLARIGVVRFALQLAMAGGRWLPAQISRLTSGGAGVAERLVGEVRKMPRDVWPMVRAHWCDPKSFHSMARHLESVPSFSREAGRERLPSDLPVIVLIPENTGPQKLAEAQALVAQSSRGKLILVPQSGHWVHLDQPQAVLEAVRDLITVTATPQSG
jgi:pimeloyl-ACP methyl ester carboxylesterase